MKVLVQRTSRAECRVNNEVVGKIDHGFMLLIGFTLTDTEDDINLLSKKVARLRIFEDDDGKINRSLIDVNGSILAISQFTLYADCKKGNRPSFTNAMPYEKANKLYEQFCDVLRSYNIKVETGVFGADMDIDFINDGPVTIMLDSKEL